MEPQFERCQKMPKMTKKSLQNLVRYLEFKGKAYQKEKMDLFNTAEAKENAKRFTKECDRRLGIIFRGLGVSCWSDIILQTEENVRRSKTCKLCGLFCNNYYTLENHRNSQNCRKRQANQKGETFVCKSQTRKQCEICDKSILFYNWQRHLESVNHLENVRKKNEPAFQCTVCDKIYKGARPKQMLKKHLRTKKHLKKLEEPWNKFKHNAIIQKHFLKCKVV